MSLINTLMMIMRNLFVRFDHDVSFLFTWPGHVAIEGGDGPLISPAIRVAFHVTNQRTLHTYSVLFFFFFFKLSLLFGSYDVF